MSAPLLYIRSSRVLLGASRASDLPLIRLEVAVGATPWQPGDIFWRRLAALWNRHYLPPLAPPAATAALPIYCTVLAALLAEGLSMVEVWRPRALDGNTLLLDLSYEDADASTAAAELAAHLVAAAASADFEPAPWIERIARFLAGAWRLALDPSARLLIGAARRRGLPVVKLDRPPCAPAPADRGLGHGMLQIGWGIRRRRFLGSLMEGADAVASVRLQQRSTVLQCLRDAGLPVAINGSAGGSRLRCLVIGGETCAVARCQPPAIRGDGILSVDQLIVAQLRGAVTPLARRAWKELLVGDAEVAARLALHGRSRGEILPAGEILSLRAAGTPANGGACEDASGTVGPDIDRLAEHAAAACGLRGLAGVDVMVDDGGKGAVLDVGAAPDLLVHAQARPAGARDPAEILLATILRPPAGHRIPVVAITGTNGKTTTARMVTAILRRAGRTVGLSCSDGVQVNDEVLVRGDQSGLPGAYRLLTDPRVEVAVLETARGGMVTEGLAFDRCDVGVCLNVEPDHLGELGIAGMDDMALHKRQVIERARHAAVLNAEDARVYAMRDHTPAATIVLVAPGGATEAVRRHCAAGGQAIVTQGAGAARSLCLQGPGARLRHLLAIDAVPATFKGSARHNVANACFAAAAAHALGVRATIIAAGLEAFDTDAASAPGRLNEIRGGPCRTVVDCAHNPHGYRALMQFVDAQAVHGRRLIVLAMSAYNPDDFIRAMIAVVAGHFDHYIIKNYNAYRAGERGADCMPRMVREELLRLGVADGAISVVPDHLQALEHALGMASAGDFLLVMAHPTDEDKWEILARLAPGI